VGESSGVRSGFDVGKDLCAQPLACEVGVDKDGADFGSVGCRVEEFGLADGCVITAEEGFAFRPAAAACGLSGSIGEGGFGDEISLVANELGVEAEDGAECALYLGGGVVVGLEAAD